LPVVVADVIVSRMSSFSSGSGEPTPAKSDAELTPMQRAVQARALRTIENEQNQPVSSPRRKLVIATLSVLMVIGLMILINYGVAIMQRIFELWMQDDAPAVTVPRPDQPFMIKVDPVQPSSAAMDAGSTSATH